MDPALAALIAITCRRSDTPPALPQTDPEWERLLCWARRLQLGNLLYFRIKQTSLSSRIPKSILFQLREDYAAACSMNLAYYNELEQVLPALSKQGVEVILLKGAALAKALYPDIGMRAFGDIDLLVRLQDVPAANRVLEKRYQLHQPPPDDGLTSVCAFHLVYHRQEPPQLSLELHWDIFPQEELFSLKPEQWRRGARRLDIGHAGALAPAPEMLLLHLCLHFTGHWFLVLRDLWDIDWMISEPGYISWDQALQLADDGGVSSRIYYALWFARRLLGTAVPEEVLKRLEPQSWANRHLFPQIINDELILTQRAATNKDIRVVIGFLLQPPEKRWFFLRRLLYPGLCWLTLFPDEPPYPALPGRIKTVLRGIRLLGYLTCRLFAAMVRTILINISACY